MGRKKTRIMSSTQGGEANLGGDIYDESINDLRRELEIRDVTINQMREQLRQQEVDNLRRTVEMLQSSLVDISSKVSENLRSSENLSFGDIEQSITKFSGREGEINVKSWIRDFENSAEIFGWSQLKQVVYAKRSLEGPAKLAIRTRDGLNTWADLKEFLLSEFSIKENAAELHELLRRRKKRSNESYEEYFLAVRELGKRASLEDNAIIKYAIDGIEEDEILKVTLYGANNIKEFKEKLQVFSKICGNIKRSFGSKRQKNDLTGRKGNSDTKKKVRCYACGDEGHIAKDCPRKKVGNKCFTCNAYGHKSIECDKKSSGADKKEVAFVSSQALRENMLKTIQVNNVEFDAFIDTGSELSFISDEIHQKLNSPCLIGPITFRGVGSSEIATTGSFIAKLEVDNSLFEERLHVVAGNILPKEIIIGRTLLNRTKLTVTPKSISLEPVPIALEEFSCLNIEAIDDLDIGPTSNDNYKDRVIDMVEAYSPKKNAEVSNFKMRIVVKDETPISQRPRRLSKSEIELVDRQIQEWLSEGIITESNSEYSSPIVLVKKKDGSTRICVDYRRLNKVIVRDHFPLPLVEDQIDRLAKAKVFTTLDLRNGFFHMPIERECRKYTSFVTPNGQFEFTRAPFGLCVSPTQFQKFVSSIFSPLIRAGKILLYIDDIIIPSNTEEEALDILEETLSIAEQNGLNIKWSKCRFLKKIVSYLGYEIQDGNVSPGKEKIAAVERFPQPKNIKGVQSFLGLTGYFRKFIENYAIIARPLSNMLKKDAKFEFGVTQLQAFEELKRMLCQKPILRIYKPDAHTELHTDASKLGYGAILLQRSLSEENLYPVHFYSKKTTSTEEKYSSYELEVLAIVNAIRKFRVYLLGIQFKLVTDCAAFRCTLEKKEVSPKIARWCMLLSEFDYVLEHRPGVRMKHVDALSRNPVALLTQTDGLLPKVQAAQKKDSTLRAVTEILKYGEFDDYLMEGGILFKYNNGVKLLAIPKAMQSEVIRAEHEKGHFGVKKMMHVMCQKYHIPKLKKKIEDFISCCIPCILASKRDRKEGYLHPIPKEAIPLETFHVDHLGPMAQTKKGYRYILAIIDGFTKFVWLYPTKGTTTAEVIEKLNLQQATFGNPSRIVTDRGTAFTSSVFENYCKEQQIEHVKITTGVPRGNGQVERVHSVVIAILSRLSLETEEVWYKHLKKTQIWINSSFQRSIGTTPFEVLFGVKMKTADDSKLTETIHEEITQLFQQERDEKRQLAARNILRMQEENAKYYNKKRQQPTKYKVGDVVAIRRTQFGTGLKLKPKYLGPYRVTKVKSNERYKVKKVGDHEGTIETTTAVDYMKPYAYFDTDDGDTEEDEENGDILDENSP